MTLTFEPIALTHRDPNDPSHTPAIVTDEDKWENTDDGFTEETVNATEPEAAPADATESASVCTVMPVELPAVAAPIVKPLSVTVKAVSGVIPAVAVVMMMKIAVGVAEVAVIVDTDVWPAVVALGVADVSKNPFG